MFNRFTRNFLNGQHIICKVQQLQTVRVTFLHQCAKNVCPTAVTSCSARMASSSFVICAWIYAGSQMLLVLIIDHSLLIGAVTPPTYGQVAVSGKNLGPPLNNRNPNRPDSPHLLQPVLLAPSIAQIDRSTVRTQRKGTDGTASTRTATPNHEQEQNAAQNGKEERAHQQHERHKRKRRSRPGNSTNDGFKIPLEENWNGKKFFEYGTDDQKAQLVDALRGHVLELALQMYGNHVIQAALKSVDKASQIEIIEELTPRSCVIRCIKDQYGSPVMKTIFELIEPQRLQFVVDAILSSPSDSVASLSLHEYGSWVIRSVLEHCTEQQKRPVLEQLLDNVPTLVTDQYGNYVIQHVIEHGRPEDRERIVRSLQGNILKTHHKSICSIIEKCLIFGTTKQKNSLIDQVCADDGTGKPPLLQMMKQQFANDVVLKMVDGADSAHRDKMMFAIEEHIPALLRLKTQELEQQNRLPKGAVADKKRKKPNNG
uniref:PUM-HD domain-containing protein n=1 Tax=Globodera pallida TaxID=36090 RepID=A0A183CMY1_GLOPA